MFDKIYCVITKLIVKIAEFFWTYDSAIKLMREQAKKHNDSFSYEETKDGLTLIITVQPEDW